MTRATAKRELRNGKKVTHRFFSKGGWIQIAEGNIRTESGFVVSQLLFWNMREGAEYAVDWEIVN